MQSQITISEAAEQAGLTVHTIRYYEREGLLPRLRRSQSGHRRFTPGDVTWALFITRLRSTGMPIRSIRRYVDLYQQGDETEAERLELLENHRDEVRAHLDEMARNLALIELKIEAYHANRSITPAIPTSETA